MSKPGGDPSSGISSEDVLIPTERHLACRQREARPGSRKKLTCSGHATNSRRYRDLGSTCLCRGRKPSVVSFAAGRQCRWSTCMERENLAGDGKGKGASGSNREAESTDAPEGGGPPCSSDEAGVMLVERRGQVIAVGSEPTGNRRSSNSRRKAAAFVRWHEPDDARVSSPDLVQRG